MSDPTIADVTPLPSARMPPAEPPPARPRVKKARLLAVLIPLLVLAVISTVFGMMMAVAADLPRLEALPQVEQRKNSSLFDVQGRKLGTLTSNEGRILVRHRDIAPYVRYAVIAIEDRRFYENAGVDLRAIGRAFYQDVVKRGPRQGGSTIAQQFVKNALQAQGERTLLNKLREAAMAYHMTRKWSKEKILTEYLNSIYFGNGAYGIEAAARTYFGNDLNHRGCGQTGRRPCAAELEPHEAALLAAVIANPSAYDPVANPGRARARRNLVLAKMRDQGRLTPAQYSQAIVQPLYTPPVRPPHQQAEAEAGADYFIAWVRQQLVDHFGAQRAFEGGLRITTTLDLDLQKAAKKAIDTYLAFSGGPYASLVALDNRTGEVRAMVGGRDYDRSPFNVATQGQRQPGSAFKPFILAEALRRGYGPGSVWPSRKRVFTVPGTRGREKFVVNNYESNYAGVRNLASALTFSDNAVFAALGIKLGTKRVARLARRMGIRTPVSTNLAMTLGGLRRGVSPLDMAHAYQTFARHGNRITGTLGSERDGPVGIRRVERNDPSRKLVARNRVERERIIPAKVADLATQMMTGVVKHGTGRRAAWDGFAAGKTGTTENSGDAWFVGFTDRLTIAVWVGYPDRLKPMENEFRGEPVEGGTFPALIWRDFVVAAERILLARVNEERTRKGLPPKASLRDETVPTTPVAPAPAPGATAPPGEQEAPSTTPSRPPQEEAPEPQPQPEQQAPAPQPQPQPQPQPPPAQPPPAEGTGGAGTGAAPPG